MFADIHGFHTNGEVHFQHRGFQVNIGFGKPALGKPAQQLIYTFY